jgi:hypothetical protein
MKTIRLSGVFMFTLLSLLLSLPLASQEPVTAQETQVRKLSVVIKNDGTEFIGYILSQDEREVLIETEKMGRVVIPKHEIREIKEVRQGEMRDGQYVGKSVFSSRYFFSSNGLPQEKGDNYALITIYGPMGHFNLAKNLTLGGFTSWVGVPIVASLKYAIPVNDYLSFGIGALGGTLSWLDFGALAGMAFGSVTIGNHNNSLTVTGGYAAVRDRDNVATSDPLFTVAGMVRLGKNISFVGDSFIYAGPDPAFVIIPGLRFSRTERKAFQIGLAGAVFEGQAIPFPIPMVGWFLKI